MTDGRRVPAVARGDEQRVNVRARGQELAHVAIHGAILVAVLVVHEPLDGLALGLLGIADGDELHVLLRQHPVQDARAPTADAHAAEHDALAGRDGAVEAQRGSGDDARCSHGTAGQRGALQEVPPGYG